MGSSANTPDIRVRLSADGVQDVINAFKRVSAEAKNIQPGGVTLLTDAFKGLSAILPSISLALVAKEAFDLSRQALDTATSLGKLAEKTGVSTGTLSVFGLAARETGTDMDGVGMALTRLTKATADAANGAAKPKKAFADLGITLNDLKTLSPDQLLIKVSTSLAAIQSPATRAQAAISLLGRQGAQLIPVFNQIAEEGFGNLEDKAKRLGVYLGDDFEEKARMARVSIGDLQAAIQGAALQFTNGAIPAIDGLASSLSALAGGGDGFYRWGQTIGAGVIYVTSGFVSLVEELKIGAASFDLFANRGRSAIDAVGSAIGVTAGVRAKFATDYASDQAQEGIDKNAINQAKTDAAQAQKALAQAYANLYRDPKSYKPQSYGSGVDGTGETPEQMAKDAAARSAYLQSLADNEVAILKTKNAIEEAEDKRTYDAGLVSLDEYFNNRADRIAKTAAAEEDALGEKLSAAQSLPQQNVEQRYKRLEEIGKIQTQIDETDLKMQGDLRANEDERSAARVANITKELETTKKLQEASGQRDAAAQTGLEIELNEYQKLLIAQGRSTEEIDKATAAYRAQGEAKIALAKNNEQASKISADYGAAGDLVDAQVGSGRITGYQGQVEKLQLQQEELDKLTAIGAQMTINANISGDPTAIQNALNFNNSLVVQQEKLKQVTTAATELKNVLSTEGRAALGDFFTSVISGSKSAADAFKDLGSAFEKIVANMISQLVVFYALEAIVGFVAPDSDFASSLQAAGPFGKFAQGGYTGNIPVDKVAGVVHGQEWVSDADTTKKYLPILQAMSDGTFDISSQGQSSLGASMQSGMNLGAMRLPGVPNHTSDAEDNTTPSVPNVTVNIENHTGQPVAQNRQKGSDGSEIITVVLGEVAKSIASGGVVGKQIQTTYGAVRQGVAR